MTFLPKKLLAVIVGRPLLTGMLLAGLLLVPFPALAEANVVLSEQLSVATLNVAHGRGDSLNQMLTGKKAIRANLDTIAEVLKRENIDVIALQESDGPSRWSGRFDHIEHLAKAANYPFYFSGEHASSFLFSYGTALLSRTVLDQPRSHQFEPSPPTLSKGFVQGLVRWNPGGRLAEPLQIVVVSLHLDFSRPSVRREQVAEIISSLKESYSDSDNVDSVILMGDFNSEGLAPDSLLHELSEAFGLQAYRLGDDNLVSYPSRGGARLDWILIGPEFEFVNYRVLADTLSDHLMVITDIVLPVQ
jgi:endonuclease/exonuclease/phosphatase family metal-dependent hydrolase